MTRPDAKAMHVHLTATPPHSKHASGLIDALPGAERRVWHELGAPATSQHSSTTAGHRTPACGAVTRHRCHSATPERSQVLPRCSAATSTRSGLPHTQRSPSGRCGGGPGGAADLADAEPNAPTATKPRLASRSAGSPAGDNERRAHQNRGQLRSVPAGFAHIGDLRRQPHRLALGRIRRLDARSQRAVPQHRWAAVGPHDARPSPGHAAVAAHRCPGPGAAFGPHAAIPGRPRRSRSVAQSSASSTQPHATPSTQPRNAERPTAPARERATAPSIRRAPPRRSRRLQRCGLPASAAATAHPPDPTPVRPVPHRRPRGHRGPARLCPQQRCHP